MRNKIKLEVECAKLTVKVVNVEYRYKSEKGN